MKKLFWVLPVLCLLVLQGCGEEEKKTIVATVEYTTIGLGPEEYRKEVVKKLKDAGVPVMEHESTDNVADISWPKSYDKLAYSIYEGPPKVELPSEGGVLNVGKCKSSGMLVQSWQTADEAWLVNGNESEIVGNKLPQSLLPGPITNIEELGSAKTICPDLEQKFNVVLNNPSDESEAVEILKLLDIGGKTQKSAGGYYYWSE